MTMRLFTVFFLSASCLLAESYTSSNWPPVPTGASRPMQTYFAFEMLPAIGYELEAGFLSHIYDGIELGVAVHGGIETRESVAGTVGGDFVLRYLKFISPSWWLGPQVQAGVVYQGLGDGTEPERATSFPIFLGLVGGYQIKNLSSIYFFPGVELGQTMRANDAVWRTGVGVRFTVGAVLPVHEQWLLAFEIRPAIADVAAPSFKLSAGLGVIFQF